jgi:hypothetical protein
MITFLSTHFPYNSQLLAGSATCQAAGLVAMDVIFPRISNPILAHFLHTHRGFLNISRELFNPTKTIFLHPAGFPNVRINSNT